MVTEDTPKDHLGRREASDRVGTVAVEEESTGHPITVKTAIRPQVVHDHAFGTFNCHFSTFITSGVVVG